ncbi:MAG: hypothetical protein LBQ59_04950, partial [Candidatus Peribacteria bacterium]|nr:hypothetical protein [Candidatus Peribacteria bacterium]
MKESVSGKVVASQSPVNKDTTSRFKKMEEKKEFIEKKVSVEKKSPVKEETSISEDKKAELKEEVKT